MSTPISGKRARVDRRNTRVDKRNSLVEYEAELTGMLSTTEIASFRNADGKRQRYMYSEDRSNSKNSRELKYTRMSEFSQMLLSYRDSGRRLFR